MFASSYLKIFFLSLIILICTIKTYGQTRVNNTQNLKFGVFAHYLHGLQNLKQPWNQGKTTSWDVCVNEFNVKTFVNNLVAVKADYVIFTLGQIDRFFCIPNTYYETVTGYKRGEATAHRDLITDLYNELNKHKIKLFLYTTGDGPRADMVAAKALHNSSSRNKDGKFAADHDWVNNWSKVLRSISLQYGSKVSGWWVDGCYGFVGYNTTLLKPIYTALKSGNPNSIVALNGGPSNSVYKNVLENYTAGESSALTDFPKAKYLKGYKWHILSYLGSEWSNQGSRFSSEYLTNYIKKVNSLNGMVTIDVCVLRDGTIDAEQMKTLVKARSIK